MRVLFLGDTTMRIVLISTSNVSSGRTAALDRMLRSVERAAAGLPEAEIRVLLLLQGTDASGADFDLPDRIDATTVGRSVPLSLARNRLLADAFDRALIDDASVVAFPDDDCWYPDGALERIAARFAADPALDLWFCRYASSPTVPADPAPFVGRPARARDVVRNASSNTIVTRGRVVREIGRFDETLGVGTPNFGGEDVDFALHAFRRSRRSAFADHALVGHRDKSADLRSRYYRGSLVVLGRHAPRVPGAWYEYARKIAIGAYLGGRGELAIGAYAQAVRDSLAAARRG